jgi:hypothetical protein
MGHIHKKCKEQDERITHKRDGKEKKEQKWNSNRKRNNAVN